MESIRRGHANGHPQILVCPGRAHLRPLAKKATRCWDSDGTALRWGCTPLARAGIAWRGLFRVATGQPRPTVPTLRTSIEGRLRHVPRCRQRLAFPAPGLGEPFWVDDEQFDLGFHVRRLGDPYEPLTLARFLRCGDDILSEPLDRRRPLWEVHLAPRLTDGRVGLVMKMHHAMVDGLSAVQLALLVFSGSPADLSDPREPPDGWTPRPAPNGGTLALRAVADSAGESLRAARGFAALAGSPLAGSSRAAATLRRTALAVGDDLLRPAPSAYVNRTIGPKRTLVGCQVALDSVLTLKRRTQTTHNDVCLAIVTGALRELVAERGDSALTMKAMVPVSRRLPEAEGSLGNRISFAFVDLPVGRRMPAVRLESIHRQTMAFKRADRAAATEHLLSALRFAPSPVKTYAARLVGSARVYNLTVSNVPGPPTPLYMLGAELEEAYPVVPLSDDHSLSIGIFTYRDRVHFGLYADPESLPEVGSLPAALRRATTELTRATRPTAARGTARGSGHSPAHGVAPPRARRRDPSAAES